MDEEFTRQSRPLVAFPFSVNGHCSVEGHRLVARAVLRALERAGR